MTTERLQTRAVLIAFAVGVGLLILGRAMGNEGVEVVGGVIILMGAGGAGVYLCWELWHL